MLFFTKYVAAGNDFIVCETLSPEIMQIEHLCDRRSGIGADGLIWIEGDFVHFFNNDGSKAAGCGNGLRVAAMHTQKNHLKTVLGEHQVEFTLGGCRVTYPDPREFHKVIEVDNPAEIFHAPQEVNVNYVKVVEADRVVMKTIERGVGETPSCGTGAISTLLTLLEMKKVHSKICAEFVSGQMLFVEKKIDTIWLEGPVLRTFSGCFG